MHLHKLTEGLILTMDEEDIEEFEEEGRRVQIKILSTWKWLLNTNVIKSVQS